MRRSRTTAVVMSLAPCLLALNGCGLGGFFGDRTPAIYVLNDTTQPLFAAGTASLDAPLHLIGSEIASGRSGAVGWGGCYSGWLVLRESDQPSAKELAKHEVSLCEGDQVTVSPDYEIVIVCVDPRPLAKPRPEC